MAKTKLVKKARILQRATGRVVDVAAGQGVRFSRIWSRLYGAPGSRQSEYTRNGLFVSAGVGLAAVVLFVLRAERGKRGQAAEVEAAVEDGSKA